jgi:hypothetical protein
MQGNFKYEYHPVHGNGAPGNNDDTVPIHGLGTQQGPFNMLYMADISNEQVTRFNHEGFLQSLFIYLRSRHLRININTANAT